MKAVLVPLDDGPPVEIQRDMLLVGRQPNCDLRIDDRTISKLHCVLVKSDGMLLVRDLGSTNGCRVNGQRVKQAALLPGDILSLAGFKFRIYLGPDDGDPYREAGGPPPTDRTCMLDEQDRERFEDWQRRRQGN